MIRKIIRTFFKEVYENIIAEKIGDFNYNKTFEVPSNVMSICKQAIKSTGSNLEKAVELSQGQAQTFNQIKKLRDFFNTNSPGSAEWNLHGGDAAKIWVDRELSKFHDENLSTKNNLRNAGGAGNKKGMGIFDTNPLDTRKGRNNIR